jgi:UDP-2,3-diacylglucosamine hydrolase
MKISCISDLHIRTKNDNAHKCFDAFVNHSKVQQSQEVYLLGDIFDMMVGDQQQYLDQYDFFFSSLNSLIKKNIKVIYVEGNHDFHLENVFETFVKNNNISEEMFLYSKDEIETVINGQKFIFCHGDIVDSENKSFQRWKSIYRSTVFRLLVNKIIPYSFAKRIGNKASSNSKKRNSKSFEYEKSKETYINGAKKILKDKTNTILVGGHTHIIEDININKCQYINNGFPIRDQKFIHIENNSAKLISLKVSSE